MKKFQRNIENFVCENCGHEISGNGYTNHCPACLWSKHVDIYPGDRLEICCSMMEPVLVEMVRDEYFITHHCIKCGYQKKNISAKEDSFDELIKIVSK